MKSGLIIVGAGGHGLVVADAAAEQDAWSQIAFLDDNIFTQSQIESWPILGKTDSASQWLNEYSDLIVAIGDNEHRLQLLKQFSKQGFNVPIICHPTACVSSYTQIGSGTVFAAQSVVNAGTYIGRGCIVNTAATIDHDNRLEDGVHVSPGAHLGGGVQIGTCSWVGIGACVRDQVSIGEYVTVGAGAAVVNDVANTLQVTGVPARPSRS